MKEYFVYILTNKYHKVFYVGYTSDIQARLYEHKNKLLEGFTKKYNVDKLVYFEIHYTREQAKQREQRLKRWRKQWKKELITRINPDWNDLADNIHKRLTAMEKFDMVFDEKNKKEDITTEYTLSWEETWQ